MDDENRTMITDKTVLFHERLEPIMDYFREDAIKTDFGELMFAVFDYSMYGTEPEFDDRLLRSYFKSLKAGVDLGRESSQQYKTEQAIKSNLKYATSEEDMRSRCERKGMTEDEIQNAVDRYRMKQNRDAGLNENGQYPKDPDRGTVNDFFRKKAGLL